MICPKCGAEAIIAGSRVEVTGDRSWLTKTEVFDVLVYQCRNRRCEANGTAVGEERIKIYDQEEKGGEGNE